MFLKTKFHFLGMASRLSKEERHRRGYTELPHDFTSAVEVFHDKPEFLERFGKDAAEQLLVVRQAEHDMLEEMFPADKEESELQRKIWLAQRY